MSSFSPALSSRLATHFRSLHKPGQPVLLTNIWDAPSAALALRFPSTKALATASFAVAAVHGQADDDLTLLTNLSAVRRIAAAIEKEGRKADVPLTVDIQNGYGEELEQVVDDVLECGGVGVNLEDSRVVVEGQLEEEGKGRTVLMSVDEAVKRIERAVKVAKAKGVLDFVVNARTDTVLLGGTIEEAIERGKRYLAAGAVTVFVWGGKRGLRDEEVKRLVEGLGGMVNVIYRHGDPTGLSVKEIGELGVARISMGPALWRKGMEAVERELKGLLEG